MRDWSVIDGGNNRKASGEGHNAERSFLACLLRHLRSQARRLSAQMRDAVYRGTMVCDKLPFTVGNGREAIEVTIAGNAVRYTPCREGPRCGSPDLGDGYRGAQRQQHQSARIMEEW